MNLYRPRLHQAAEGQAHVGLRAFDQLHGRSMTSLQHDIISGHIVLY
jgi:hypothetical protein